MMHVAVASDFVNFLNAWSSSAYFLLFQVEHGFPLAVLTSQMGLP